MSFGDVLLLDVAGFDVSRMGVLQVDAARFAGGHLALSRFFSRCRSGFDFDDADLVSEVTSMGSLVSGWWLRML